MKEFFRPSNLSAISVVVLLVAALVLTVGVDRKLNRPEPLAESTSATSVEPTVEPPVEPTNVVLIGEYSAGSEFGGRDVKNWTALVSTGLQGLQPTRVVRDSSDASGYVAHGAYGDTYGDAAKLLVKPDADYVVIYGSSYDMFAAPQVVRDAATATYDLVRATAPAAHLIIVGPSWSGDLVPPELLATRDTVREAALAAGARWIDPLQEDWFAGNHAELVGADNVHPTDLGHERIALGVYEAVKAALNE
jgi:lysophospholipase L1-like esterase